MNFKVDQKNKEKESVQSVFIVSNGCVPNLLVGKRISKLFFQENFKVTNNLKKADIIIFNSCGYSGSKIEESYYILSRIFKQKQSECKVILTGCIDKIQSEFKNKFANCQIIDTTEIHKVFKSDITLDDLYVSDQITDRLETTKKDVFNVITSKGCLGNCSYCAIKKARGIIKSKPTKDIIEDFNNGLKSGYKKFVLWGDDLGAYGLDIGSSYINLLRVLLIEIASLEKITIYLQRLNPQWIIKSFHEFLDILSTKIIRLIYSPIQSGDDRILSLMNRNYHSADIKRCFQIIKKSYPEIILKTDIMVGFPSESKQEFRNTLNLINEINFDDIIVFKYSGISDTPSYYLKGQIDEKEKDRRFQLLWRKFLNLRYSLEFDFDKGIFWILDKKNFVRIPANLNIYSHPLDLLNCWSGMSSD